MVLYGFLMITLLIVFLLVVLGSLILGLPLLILFLLSENEKKGEIDKDEKEENP